MPEPSDGQKEIQQLQTRILTLEETISSLKNKGDESRSAQSKITELESQLKAIITERDDLKQKIWDKKERRDKERRLPVKRDGLTNIKEEVDDWEIASGHF